MITDKETLQKFLALIESYERRFFYTVDRGYEVKSRQANFDEAGQTVGEFTPRQGGLEASEAYLREKEADIERAAKQIEETRSSLSTQNDEQVRAQLQEKLQDLEATTDLLESRRATVLVECAYQAMKEHIRLRLKDSLTEEDTKRLDYLKQQASEYTTAIYGKMALFRAKIGFPDQDSVLSEMVGEPLKIFAASCIPNGNLDFFYKGREVKAQNACEQIERVKKSLLVLTEHEQAFEKSPMAKAIEDFAEAAKQRARTPRENLESFKENDDKLRVKGRRLVDRLAELSQPRPAATRDLEPSHLAIGAMKQGISLIYDMAIIRLPRAKSTQNLELSVAECVEYIALRQHAAESARSASRAG